MQDRLRSIRREARIGIPRPVSGDDLARLESLGYVGGSAVPLRPDGPATFTRTDPKIAIGALPFLEAGLYALRRREVDDARAQFNEALRLDPGNLVALNNLGILSMQEADAAAAEEHYRRALQIDPGAEKILSGLGLALTRQGRHDSAIESYRRALEVRPGFTAARFNLALALHRSGRVEEALGELERVAHEEPEFPGLEETLERLRSTTPPLHLP
jgi:tetratricopeptide (TPR) repeat protein